MKAFLTGATGYVGGEVARQLRERGDDVVALVRTPSKAERLRELGCALVEGDLEAVEAMRHAAEGCDAVFHIAGMYEVGIPRSRRSEMFDANVGGTDHALDAAAAAGVPRVVYVSTINVFGNTGGSVHPADRVPERREFLSTYDETKYLAHRVAERRTEDGVPVIIVSPGGIYGPDDPSDLGTQLDNLRRGRRMPVGLDDVGLNMLHVEDAARGIILAHDKGDIGEHYVLGGQIGTLADFLGTAARLLGRRPPRSLPTPLIKMAIPFGRLVGRAMGTNPNLRELIRVADGVTYWASDEKARRELGYDPRDLETGLRDTLAASR